MVVIRKPFFKGCCHLFANPQEWKTKAKIACYYQVLTIKKVRFASLVKTGFARLKILIQT
jgi:hypothetical protein